MLLRVIHETHYAYTPAVKTAQHMAHLKPVDSVTQRLVAHRLHVSPTPDAQSETRDVYGNTRAFFSLQSAHDALTVVADSLVATSPAPALPHAADAAQTWEQVRERMRYQVGAPYDPAAEFVFASPYVPRDEAFAEYARASFTPGRPLLEAAAALMERIHHEFEYDSKSTEVNTPALQALAQRRGVCQDFAHIMVACCRALGLPARYVSGYMLTEPPPGQARLVGADASHAWASVYLPRALPDDAPLSLGSMAPAGQWIDLDPTNNRAPGEDYITVAIGRDYADVSPVRGVIHGGADHVLSVSVTVAPQEEDAHGATQQQQ